MSIQLPVKIFVLVSLLTMIAEGPSCAQQEIEKYLLEQDLISESQLNTYKDKEKAGDEYVRLMIKLMKGEKGDRKYKREMENEYREEVKKRNENKDTLSILANILEESRGQGSHPEIAAARVNPDDTTETYISSRVFKPYVNDSIQQTLLLRYVSLLRSNRLIKEEFVKKLSEYINNSSIYDSCSVVNKAIGLRDKSILTATPRLIELANLLKDLDVLSKQKHEQLVNSSFPDSVSKIFNIISNCEKVTFFPGNNFMVNGKKQFDQLIEILKRLTGIEVYDLSLTSTESSNTPGRYRSFVTLELYHNGKKFIHEENETISTIKDLDVYSLNQQSIYKIFNKILAYKNSAYRIHELQERNPPYVHSSWGAYILLSQPQSEGLYHNENITISYEENMNPLPVADILKAIDLYKKVGLFNKVTQNNIDSVLLDIKANPVYRYNELISRFASISLIVDERFQATPEELVAQIKKLADLSGYFFDPENIRIMDSTGKRWILFELNNKTYSSSLDDPWMNAWQIVNHPTVTELKENPFESLRIAPHKEIIIYLPSKNMKMLEKEKVIGDW